MLQKFSPTNFKILIVYPKNYVNEKFNFVNIMLIFAQSFVVSLAYSVFALSRYEQRFNTRWYSIPKLLNNCDNNNQ